MFYDSDYTSVRDIELYTDAASTIGYGGYFKGKWFCSPWPDDLNSPCEKKFSMAFLELYPIVVAAILWGHSWTTKRILFRCDNEATVHIVNKARAVQDTCTFSGQSTSQVPASLTSNVALKSTVSDLWRHVLSTRTSQTYKVGYRAYTAFLANNGVVWLGKPMPPISEDILIYFVAHCYKNLRLLHTTIKLYLCGIRFYYIQSNCDHPFDYTNESTLLRLNMIMRAVKRIQGEHNSKPRLPITFQVLGRISNSLRAGVFSTFTDYPLFVKENGNALDRDFFIRSLRHVLDICGYNSSLYNGHSFRIGASTSAGSVNIQDHLIKTLGRWTSDSYCRYIRISNDTIRKAQKSLTLSKNT
ncbi:Hypothetical predicted protein [Mytilus galloprovincialis]|uniref:Tyr recombinase domain-containing protein n=1 Tax=Mytilus galloprovincialis TaxID=29158 RepID=A0A8B6C3M9_MYTGA|nr:Hypothetical predicted protein [Mytilus galloprovincialis]